MTGKQIEIECVEVLNNEGSVFRDLLLKVETHSKNIRIDDAKASEVILSLYNALQNTLRGFHKVYIHAIHVPDLEVLDGKLIKEALGNYFAYYTASVYSTADLATKQFKDFLLNLHALRDALDLHFTDAQSQLEFYDVLINYSEEFTKYSSGTEIGELPNPDFAVKIKNEESSQINIRNLQHGLLECSVDCHSTGRVYSSATGLTLLEKFNIALVSINHFNEFTGWLAQNYDSRKAGQFCNPQLFAQYAKQMVITEVNAEIFGNDVDPGDKYIKQAIDRIDINQHLMSVLAKDEDFFGKLCDEYYIALNEVNDSQNAYIKQRQTSIKAELDGHYADGNNDISDLDLDILGKPSKFIAQFSGGTINRLPAGLASGRLNDTHPRHLTQLDLNLTAKPLFTYLRGFVPTSLLAAEYLRILKFWAARQTNKVHQPTIPFERKGQAAKDTYANMQPNIKHEGDTYHGFITAKFFDDSPDWNLDISIAARLSSNPYSDVDVFALKFYGSFSDICVPGALWYRNHEWFSAPGGHGCYHWRLRNALAPMVKAKFTAGSLRMSMSKPLITSPDVNQWFIEKRTMLGKELTVKAAKAGKDISDSYANAMLRLDLATCKLKLFAKFAGKDINNSAVANLLTSASILAEIKANVANTDMAELTPTITEQLATTRMAGKTILMLQDSIMFMHPKNLLNISKKQLVAHCAWRITQKPLMKVKAITPEYSISLDVLPLDLEILKVKNRNLSLEEVRVIGFKIRKNRNLKQLTLKNLDLETDQTVMLLSAALQLPVLQKVDLSFNALEDESNVAESFLKVLNALFSKQGFETLNLSFTNVSSNTLRTIAVALTKNPALKSLKLLEIQLCKDTEALDLLAALFINTNLTELQINGTSINILIADAINYILAHKHNNKDTIPQELNSRLRYFDDVLNVFLNKIAVESPVLDVRRNVFPHVEKDGKKVFSLQARVRNLASMKQKSNAVLTQSDIVKTPKTFTPMRTYKTTTQEQNILSSVNRDVNEYTNGIAINNAYLYEEVDIDIIMNARVKQESALRDFIAQDIIQVIGAVHRPEVLQIYIPTSRAQHPSARIFLIPYNLGGNHWVGLLLEYTNDGAIARAEYSNSMGDGGFDQIQQAVHGLDPNCNVMRREALQQNDCSSCGAFTIENLILCAKHLTASVDGRSSLDIRLQHLNCLREYRPDFYNSFYPRQRDNKHTYDASYRAPEFFI